MTAMTASEARKNLFGLVRQVNDDSDEVTILSKNGNAVLVGEDYWNSIKETMFLMSQPGTHRRLMESLARVRQGEHTERELIDPSATEVP